MLTKLLACFYIAPIVLSADPISDNIRGWKYAYQGDWNLTHKYVVSKPLKESEDIIIVYLMMAYSCYRNADEEGMYSYLKEIDGIIEQENW